jgi:2-C-methyl-D-erythritol 4-phosphate cytidylyltransferase
MDKVGVIVVAAGAGRRMGSADKIFIPLSGKPLLAHTLDAFQSCSAIDNIILVLPEGRLDEGRRLIKDYSLSKVKDVCPGGERRQDSVKAGLQRLTGCQWVMIHDGARPCVRQNTIEDALKAARDSGAAIPAVPVSDTIKVVSADQFVQKTLLRDRLWTVQTPQVFRFDIISEAHSKAKGGVTDDASLVERLGYKVKIFPGSPANIKVTTPDDIAIAEAIMKNLER